MANCGTCGSDNPTLQGNTFSVALAEKHATARVPCPDAFHKPKPQPPRPVEEQSEEEWVRCILQEEYERPAHGLGTPLYWLRLFESWARAEEREKMSHWHARCEEDASTLASVVDCLNTWARQYGSPEAKSKDLVKVREALDALVFAAQIREQKEYDRANEAERDGVRKVVEWLREHDKEFPLYDARRAANWASRDVMCRDVEHKFLADD